MAMVTVHLDPVSRTIMSAAIHHRLYSQQNSHHAVTICVKTHHIFFTSIESHLGNQHPILTRTRLAPSLARHQSPQRRLRRSSNSGRPFPLCTQMGLPADLLRRLRGAAISQLRSVPAITRSLVLWFLLVALISTVYTLAQHTSFCAHTLQALLDPSSASASASAATTTPGAGTSTDAGTGTPTGTAASAAGAVAAAVAPSLWRTVTVFARLALFPLVPASTLRAVLASVATLSLGTPLELWRGSAYLLHALAAVTALISLFTFLLFAVTTRLFPSLAAFLYIATDQSLSAAQSLSSNGSLPAAAALPAAATCFATPLCFSGPDAALFALLLIDAAGRALPSRRLPGCPLPLSATVAFPAAAALGYCLFYPALRLEPLVGAAAAAVYTMFLRPSLRTLTAVEKSPLVRLVLWGVVVPAAALVTTTVGTRGAHGQLSCAAAVDGGDDDDDDDTLTAIEKLRQRQRQRQQQRQRRSSSSRKPRGTKTNSSSSTTDASTGTNVALALGIDSETDPSQSKSNKNAGTSDANSTATGSGSGVNMTPGKGTAVSKSSRGGSKYSRTRTAEDDDDDDDGGGGRLTDLSSEDDNRGRGDDDDDDDDDDEDGPGLLDDCARGCATMFYACGGLTSQPASVWYPRLGLVALTVAPPNAVYNNNNTNSKSSANTSSVATSKSDHHNNNNNNNTAVADANAPPAVTTSSTGGYKGGVVFKVRPPSAECIAPLHFATAGSSEVKPPWGNNTYGNLNDTNDDDDADDDDGNGDYYDDDDDDDDDDEETGGARLNFDKDGVPLPTPQSHTNPAAAAASAAASAAAAASNATASGTASPSASATTSGGLTRTVTGGSDSDISAVAAALTDNNNNISSSSSNDVNAREHVATGASPAADDAAAAGAK